MLPLCFLHPFTDVFVDSGLVEALIRDQNAKDENYDSVFFFSFSYRLFALGYCIILQKI